MLFAVLEARHCTAPEPAACESLPAWTHDTVAIAGSDGFAKAKTTFTARKIPAVGNAATVLDLEGQVAAGAVYFVDGAGTVRRLTSDGSVKTVASFPITSNQSISFAVSPDGKTLIAAVLTYPINLPQTDPSQPPWGTFSGPWKLQIEKASISGSASLLHQWQSSTSQYPNGPGGFANIWLVGWDAQGPIALVGQPTGTQNAWLSNQRYFAGSLARMNADGTPGQAIGPANCLPYWRPSGGLFACSTLGSTNASSVIDVIDLSGKVVWSGHPAVGQYQTFGDFFSSPDGAKLAMDDQVVDLQSNATVQLASTFQPQGWLDNQTLIGWLPQNGPTAPHIGVLHLSDPKHPEDWGFTGAFVGVL